MQRDVQAYPTSVRSFGLGFANMCSRVGAVLAPFFAVYLVRQHLAAFVEVFMAVACFLGGAAAMCIPIETAGRSLLVSSACVTRSRLQLSSPTCIEASTKAWGLRLSRLQLAVTILPSLCIPIETAGHPLVVSPPDLA